MRCTRCRRRQSRACSADPRWFRKDACAPWTTSLGLYQQFEKLGPHRMGGLACVRAACELTRSGGAACVWEGRLAQLDGNFASTSSRRGCGDLGGMMVVLDERVCHPTSHQACDVALALAGAAVTRQRLDASSGWRHAGSDGTGRCRCLRAGAGPLSDRALAARIPGPARCCRNRPRIGKSSYTPATGMFHDGACVSLQQARTSSVSRPWRSSGLR
jgi:hypothetical protein